MEMAGRSTVRFYRKHRALDVLVRLGMTPLSLGLHSVVARAPGLLSRLDRSGAKDAGFGADDRLSISLRQRHQSGAR